MTKKQKKVLYRIFASALIYAALLAAMHLWPGFSRLPFYVQVAAFGVPYLIIGFDVLYKAVRGIINLSPFDENLLMCIATIAAFAIGEFEESVAVMLFYQVGELFQSYAVGKSRESITDLMSIAPEYANIESDAGVEKVDPDDVGVGDIIVIRPGEKVPLDGEIIEGESFFDTSPLTGESVPRKAGVGDSVISGCINKDGTVRVRVQKEYEESTVARILELVEESSEKKAQLENFITRFARYYTPIVTLSALALAVIPPLVFGEPYGSWIHRACTFLIVSCPCALVISVPLGFFAGIGAASRDGILIKGGNYLEAACDATTFAFDKTGTLTKGEFNVRRVVVASDTGLTERELLMLAAAVENYSIHPIAGAIVSEAKKYHMPTDDISITAQREIAGRGIIAYVKYPGKDIEKVYVGNAALLNDEGISIDVDHLSGTVVCIGIDGEPAGVIVIDDQLKDEAVGSLKALRETGVEKLVLISGDKDEAAGRIARESNLDEYYAELLPADKIETLEKLMKENEGLTCYVGDGINDAPVLMRADLGIAMGAAGSDAAIEAADIVLMDDDLRKLPRLVRLAKRVRRIVRQNIVFAIGVKLIVLALGAVGVATLWAAVFADVGVAVLTILNSMRLLKR